MPDNTDNELAVDSPSDQAAPAPRAVSTDTVATADYPLLDLNVLPPAVPSGTEPSPLTRLIEIRVLTPEEIRQYVEPVFQAKSAVLPNNAASFFVGAVNSSGRVMAWLTVQSVIHTEPVYTEPGQAQLFGSLVKAARAEILRIAGPCKVYMTADDERVILLARHMGMQQEPGIAMTQWIGLEPPAGRPS